MFEKIAEH